MPIQTIQFGDEGQIASREMLRRYDARLALSPGSGGAYTIVNLEYVVSSGQVSSGVTLTKGKTLAVLSGGTPSAQRSVAAAWKRFQPAAWRAAPLSWRAAVRQSPGPGPAP